MQFSVVLSIETTNNCRGKIRSIALAPMLQMCFLYKGDEPGSVSLRDRLASVAIVHGVRMWSDTDATDPGFARQLRDELFRADAIIQCVGPKGIGFYQGINEVDVTFDALQGNASRRLLVVLLDGAKAPNAFARFDGLPNAKPTIERASAGVDAVDVLRAALPDVAPVDNAPESNLAKELIIKTLTQPKPRCLTIIVGPYAAAETNESGNTPERTIAWLLKQRGLPGNAPWFDVMASVACSTFDDPDDAAKEVQNAIDATSGARGTLEIYLRLLAANWARQASPSRLIIIVCTPGLRLDIELRSSAMPVRHVRLVHRPQLPDKLFAERIEVGKATPDRIEIPKPLDALRLDDRVVVIKPFGCFEDLKNLLISAEQWRDTNGRQMPLPTGLATEISTSAILVLGAGAFSPSLNMVFRVLLKDALANPEGHRFRFLVHDQRIEVPDELHRLERALADPRSEYSANFAGWLRDFYQLYLRRLEPITLLANFDHQLNRRVP
jgi:hypothetical protein